MISTRLALGIVCGAILLGALLRAIGLDGGLWYDEILTLTEHVRQPWTEVVGEYSRNNHVLYTVLAKASVSAFGETPWTLRLPAVAFGIACIPAMYAFGVTVTSRLEALLATGLLTVSYHHIWFSQNARGYTALAFWTLLSTLCLLRGLRDGRLRWHIAYGCAAALGFYTHLTMGFVIVAQFFVSIGVLAGLPAGDGKRMGKRTAAGFSLAALISLVLYAPLLSQLQRVWERSPNDHQVQAATFQWAVLEVLQNVQAVLGFWGLVLGGLLLGTGFFSYLKENRVFALLVVLSGLVTLVGLIALNSPLRPRFFFPLIGFAFLFAVRGAMMVATWIRRGWGARPRIGSSSIGAALTGCFMLANVASLGYLYRYPKQDYTSAARFVESTREADEAVVTAGLAVMPYRDFYGMNWTGVQSRDDLEGIRARSERVWMVYTFVPSLKAGLKEAIAQECTPVRDFKGTVGGGAVVVCVFGSP